MTDKASVEAVLDKIRPALQADGGDIELVGVENDKVTVKLTGHCAG
jgi:Fe-S cluster biogenesis protein NfuA